jgi:hypothetical protein
MKKWKKQNKTRMKIWYTMDKYRESSDYLETIETLEGYQAYLNTPMAASYVNIEVETGEIISVSRELVLKVRFLNLPDWTLLGETQVSDAAKMRILNLDNDLEIQRETFDQEKRLREAKGEEFQ